MEEKKKVCSEAPEQKENVVTENDNALTDEELEDAAGGEIYKPSRHKKSSIA